MIQALRRKLTLLFLSSFLLIYLLGGAAALLVFYSGLSTALDEELSDLCSEILPAIKLAEGNPSLKDWAAEAKKEHLNYPAGIQIFDANKVLMEKYGLSGKELRKGEFELIDQNKKHLIRSSFEKLIIDGKLQGYLQVQMTTAARDSAVIHFAEAMLFILPFLSVVVAFAGYFFSGLAIKPVERSIEVLKTFVADAGHEFITPITVVEASLQTLEEILTEHGIGLEILGIIGRASNSMKELSNDLIYLAKIENPDMQLSRETISIHEFIDPSIESLIEVARAKKVELSSAAIPDLSVMGNQHALKTLFSNLLSNAIKYTDEGGKVRVKVSQDGTKVCIAVEDTGIGIPQANLDQIFDRFYRVDKSRARSAGGSGLGLAIVKAIVELHQGEIDVQSSPGKGSTFTVRLPRT